MRLLDLFCGAGGCSVGYARAGFDVVGVDINPQPHYPFEFHQADAMTYPLDGFDALHASPPCQDHILGGLQSNHGTGWMLAEIRRRLEERGRPWVIENVPGAPMRPDYVLCGSHFGLPVRRHRWFETSWRGFSLMACDHSKQVHGVYGHPHGRNGAWPGMLPGGLTEWSQALGIDWMTASELAQAIPPAYTERIGTSLLAHLSEVAA
jgi:DNA (cytosine-5)-methyltransferase 1